MSRKHPIISVTGSSGAGTTSVMRTFEQIFRREGVNAAFVEGDSFHRYDRVAMKAAMAEAQARGDHGFSHFGAEANLFSELEELFRTYGDTGTGKVRKYLHDDVEAAPYGQQPGTFTPWDSLPADTDLLFYEGLHGAVVTDTVDIARYGDLRIGVVPVINLEWIQKLHRDKVARGYTAEAVTETILRRMPDYVNYMCPQFTPHRRELPARARRRHLEPVHRPDHPDGRRVDADHPVPRSARDRLPLPAVDAARLVHVAREHDRVPRRQDGSRHAADLHTDDPALDGAPPRRARDLTR
jgi:phosphoribulokinase